MPRLPVTVLACLALAGGTALAGCGSDDSDDAAGAPAAETAAPQQDSSSQASGDVVEVNMKDIEFVPENVTAKVGQKIVWTNTDGQIPHTVTSSDGADFDSGNMDGGDTFDYTPTKAGTINYICTIHSGQTGSIEVTKE
ncbi:MAG: cupredoxin domain-containing protein [Solirubrobacteraceae bacterium]